MGSSSSILKRNGHVTYVGPEVGGKTRDLMFCPIKIRSQLPYLQQPIIATTRH